MSFFRDMANMCTGIKAQTDRINFGNPNYDPLGAEFNCFSNPVLRPTFDPVPQSIFNSNCCMGNSMRNPFAMPVMQPPIMSFLPMNNISLPQMFGIEQQALAAEPTYYGVPNSGLKLDSYGIPDFGNMNVDFGTTDFGIPDAPFFNVEDISSNRGVSRNSKITGKRLKGNISNPLTAGFKITSGFGMRKHPTDHVVKMHNGIDIPAPMGTPIKAVADGRVIVSCYEDDSDGNVVKIRHSDGSISSYSHCSSLNVEPGAFVQKGQLIAKIGSTGKSTGPHLHFAIRNPQGKFVDPSEYLCLKGKSLGSEPS